MKKAGTTILNVFIIVVLTELIYWTSKDLLIFNENFLNSGLTFFYYASASIIALLLTILLIVFLDRIPVFFSFLFFVLINTYVLFSILQLITKGCEEIKNLNAFHTTLIVVILFVTGCLVIFRIIPKMKLISIVTVAISTLLAFIDFLIFLYGFRIFYPGFW